MRRSLSAGAAGAVFLGAVFAVANAADQKPVEVTTVSNDVIVTEPILETIARAYDTETKIAAWGVPGNIVLLEKEPEAEEAPAAEEAPVVGEAAAEEAVVEAPVAEEAPAVEETAAPVEKAPVAEETAAAPAAAETVVPVAKQQAAAPAETKAAAPATTQAAQTKQTSSASQTAETKTETASTGTNQSRRQAVVNAAKGFAAANAQTDCTMLVTNSLKAIGVNFHGWPADYMSLGRTVSASEAQPGDIIYYASNGFGQAHVALYIGNGQAVHGGWNGMGTTIFSVNLPSASTPIFISPSAYNG